MKVRMGGLEELIEALQTSQQGQDLFGLGSNGSALTHRTRSVSCGAAATRVGGAGEAGRLSAGTVLDCQGVGVAEGILGGDQVVAEDREVVADALWDAFLDHEQVGDDVAEARRGDSLLYVHFEVEHVGDHLRRRLLDGASAGGSERDAGLPSRMMVGHSA